MRNFLLWCAVFAFCALFIYDIKYNVHNAQKDTYVLERQLIKERERLHMVELEWTRLSRPERIAALAKQHLTLHFLDSEQLMPQEIAMWKISTLSTEQKMAIQKDKQP